MVSAYRELKVSYFVLGFKQVFTVPEFTSFNPHCQLIPMYCFTDTIPTPSTANAPIIPTALEFRDDELEEVKKWTSRYSDLRSKARFEMLKDDILPKLFLLNKHLSTLAWKERKAVSTH